jgi:hypothetical protein
MEDRPAIPEPSVPSSISYRQLAEWLQKAPAEADPVEATSEAATEPAADESLEAVFASWAQSSRQLLEVLQRQGKALSRGRSPRQMMALGALQAHLTMALQAHAASGRRAEDR